jgi:hypothetical protein
VLELPSLPHWVRGTNGAGSVASVLGPVKMPTMTALTGRPLAWKVSRPRPFFSELHILKGFKSCVLKLRILQALQARFAELRMVKELAQNKRWLKVNPSTALRAGSSKLKGQRAGELNAEARRTQRRGERFVGGLSGGLNIENGSMGLARR